MSRLPYNPDPLEVLTAMFEAPCLLPAQRIVMWTYPRMVRPALSAVRHGAGDLLLALSPMNHRPLYYLVWIDSAWWPEGDDLDLDHLDDIWLALEDEFGRRERKDNGDFRRNYCWPEVDDSDGCCWRRARPEDVLAARARRRLIPSWQERNAGVDVPLTNQPKDPK